MALMGTDCKTGRTDRTKGSCRRCGCTETRACHDVVTGTGCYWVDCYGGSPPGEGTRPAGPLCSVCAHPQLDHKMISELIRRPFNGVLSLRDVMDLCNGPTLLAARVIAERDGDYERAAMIATYFNLRFEFSKGDCSQEVTEETELLRSVPGEVSQKVAKEAKL